MKLKVLMARKKLTGLQAELETLRSKKADFDTRESELEAAIAEAETDEERSAVEEEIEAFDSERNTNAAEITRVEGEISDVEADIVNLETAVTEARQKATPSAPARHERTEVNMNTAENRMGIRGMNAQQREALLADADVKTFIQRVREFRAQKRSASGAELGVPNVLLGILRDTVDRYSKLLQYVNCVPLKGTARQNIAGAVPEAIWTEAVGALNELDISFTQIEVDGYKVAGYLAVPNSTLEDDEDLDLLATIVDMMGQAIGYAVDKAIVYGTGSKMPVGFVTRLAATSKPSWWGPNQGEFTNLSASNVLKLNLAAKVGADFFQTLIVALGVAKPNYAGGTDLVWIMNRTTHIDLLSRCLAFDLNAALIAGMNNTMPVIGGQIIELEFMADGDIGGGYAKLMRLVERSGANIGNSDQPLYIEDQTVFKATQRYDGKPARGEAFVLLNYKNVSPSTTVPFGFDYANEAIGTLIVTTAAGAATGKTAVTVAGAETAAALQYIVGGQPVAVKNGAKLSNKWAAIASGDEVAAQSGSYITVVEVDAGGRAVKVGSGVATAQA